MNHLFGGFFQLGYVTRNLDAACSFYRDRFGEVDFMINEPGPIAGMPSPTRRLALAYLDDVMTEIIEPDFRQATIFADALPDAEGHLALHHFGYLVDDHQANMHRLVAAGYSVPFHGTMEDVLDYSYADTRAHLGHYCEFIRLDDAGREFFSMVPRFTTR